MRYKILHAIYHLYKTGAIIVVKEYHDFDHLS